MANAFKTQPHAKIGMSMCFGMQFILPKL
ncbi:hypothetical protein OIU77_006774 [Salix suchowensis]|uniref:Uncharacterized protein n=1 Tax=Salix suchowensis TaxID=1278906 RepID=A0ABQ9ALV2_9ROSI|nr:hypothetical protein OIU77_006774 [Salix suchowensis]